METLGGNQRFAIVPPMVHLYGAPCYQSLPGDGGVVSDLDGPAAGYELCGVCFPPDKPEDERS